MGTTRVCTGAGSGSGGGGEIGRPQASHEAHSAAREQHECHEQKHEVALRRTRRIAEHQRQVFGEIIGVHESVRAADILVRIEIVDEPEQ